MALSPQVIDVPFLPPNQQPAKHMGPVGRIQSLKDCVIDKYLSSAAESTRIRVTPRPGFGSLSTVCRNVASGAVAVTTWDVPELLANMGDKLISIASSIPRVYNGATWSSYNANRVLTGKLSQSIVHTPNRTIQAPSSATLNGVTCHVWSETNNGLQSAFYGFRNSTGAWLVKPTVVSAAAANEYVMIKTVTDGTRFWTVNSHIGDVFIVRCFNTNGELIDTDGTIVKSWTAEPGYWDFQFHAGLGVCLAQAAGNDGVTDDGVTFSKLSLSGSNIVVSSYTDSTINCAGPVQFITNNTADLFYYLVTEDTLGRLWGYQTTAIADFSHETATFATVSVPLDTIVGYVTDSATPTMYVAYGLSANTAPAAGPANDPGLRMTVVKSITWTNTITTEKTVYGVVPVTRAFENNTEFYFVSYWQSGGGIGQAQAAEEVTWTSGDYMLGDRIQPLELSSGDGVKASEISQAVPAASTNTLITQTYANSAITGADTVTMVDASDMSTNGNSFLGNRSVPDGTTVMRWEMANLSALASASIYIGGKLVVAGSSINSGTWDVIGIEPLGDRIWTYATNAAGAPGTAGTFAAAGTFQINSMRLFMLPGLPDEVRPDAVEDYLFASSPNFEYSIGPVTGTIDRMFLGSVLENTFGYGPSVWTSTTNAAFSGSGAAYTATYSPGLPNRFFAFLGQVDDASIGSDLVLAGDTQVPANNGTYEILDVDSSLIEVDAPADNLRGERFSTSPAPTLAIELNPLQNAFTFFLQSLALDFRYLNALVSVQDAEIEHNNGLYRIEEIIDADTFRAVPADGRTGQHNELFQNTVVITIFFEPNSVRQFQPTWFITPMTTTQSQVGCFERGIAYADWRTIDSAGDEINTMPLSVSDVSETSTGLTWLLPYRAQSVTSALPLATTKGQINSATPVLETTVGLKQFSLATETGLAVESFGELLIPGPQASQFADTTFVENGTNLGMEQPFLVSQDEADADTLALTKLATYQYSAVAEYTDENGNRIFSPPSPPITVELTGDNNQIVIGGRTLDPLTTLGNPVIGGNGVTNRRVTISLYRTVTINDVQSVQKYKITNDLNVNGLAPVSVTNPSGFAFPSPNTWTYTDQNPDVTVSASEILYTDKSYLPRFAAPAFSSGAALWKNRAWLIGYDGAVWMSGEKTEGDALWFFPAFRYPFPAEDQPVKLVPMDDFLLVLCRNRSWYIPATTFPDASGRGGSLPTPVRLGFSNGCTGHATAISSGVAYSSTAGGIWLITRGLTNQWLSQDLEDEFQGKDITGMAVDEQQRLHVCTGSEDWFVYDQVVNAWYHYRLQTSPELISTMSGQVAFQDSTNVALCFPESVVDQIGETEYAITPDMTLADISLGNVRGQKMIWAIQVLGKYIGPHQLNAVISYPDTDEPDTTFDPYSPDPDSPYLIEINPRVEELSTFGLRLYTTFTDLSPGASAAWELISIDAGIDSRTGQNKRPDVSRAEAA